MDCNENLFFLKNNRLLLLFWWGWGLNSGHCTCKAGILLLESYLKSIFALVILEVGEGLMNYLPELALSYDFSAILSLSSNEDYLCEPLLTMDYYEW
jgi:hypothetical protein